MAGQQAPVCIGCTGAGIPHRSDCERKPIERWENVRGQIQKGEKYTIFFLEMRAKNGLLMSSSFRADNRELGRFPQFYKQILDRMVWEIEKRIR